VFVAGSEEKRLASVLAPYCRTPVLTVSDIDNFASRGGVIGLVMEDQVVRIAINRTAAEEARLRISAQVYHLAVPLFSAVSRAGRKQTSMGYISQILTPSPGAISIESNDGLSRMASRVRSTCILDCDQSIPCSAVGEMTTDLPPIQLLVSTTR